MHFAPFTHLHTHSDFSLLSGAVSVSALLKRVVQMQQPALALTDYGNLFGAVEFYSQAMKLGIKPILGCEVFLCDDYTTKKIDGRQPDYPQLVLLARTNHGWKNLMKLVSISWLEGFYYKPRIDKKLLAEFGDGLIALSSGWNGEIERKIRRGDMQAAKDIALEYRDLFPNNCFFIELQRHNNSEQESLNRKLITLSRETDIHLVATNNAHFLERADFHAFEAMLALQKNRTLNDSVAGHFTPDCYLKTHDEMIELFQDIPEAVENSMHIASRCNIDMQFGNYQLPDFIPPDGSDLKQYMQQLANSGLDNRWLVIVAGRPDALRKTYDERLNYELGIIESMGFPGYFLIVADFIQWARDHDIPVGPGRGSGAGSLVAYVLGITDLDPLRYGLLFERFLNPERISMPDFDIDFCMSRRDDVIRYVTEKYGEDHVAQIITYGSMKAKAVVRDVGRVLDMPLPRVNELAKLIPNDLSMTLEKAFIIEPKLAKLAKEEDDVARLFNIARKLEGMHRHAGRHAAGVVIGRTPLVDTAPLYRDPKEGSAVVQWDMKSAEKVGLIKFDFLGLKTLTVLHIACHLLRIHGTKDTDKHFDLNLIPLDNHAAFQLLQRGATSAVFQLESSGMRDLLTRLRPDCFEDIIALVALYRPGPLESGMVDTFIECKRGDKEVTYTLSELEPILKETYGVILYQEQVMKIAQVLAGYSLGQADMLRRAMGKKIPAEMEKQRSIFMQGSAKKGHPAEKAEQIFDLMVKFAGYGFNKSHSAAYALIAYQTAYLKAHNPLVFMAATLSCDMGNSDKVAMLIRDCKSMNIEILPPDINDSAWQFIPEGKKMRFGLGAIKGVGEAAIGKLISAREKGGDFKSFEDMLMRIDSSVANKRMLEALIMAGALHAIIPHQRAAIEGMAAVINQAKRKSKEAETMQSSLFSGSAQEKEEEKEPWPDVPAWRLGECLQHERDILGFYLTGHPLEAWVGKLHGVSSQNLAEVKVLKDHEQVIVPVAVSTVKTHHGKQGLMAFVQLEDLHDGIEMFCFASLYAKVSDALVADNVLLIAGRIDHSKEEPSLVAEAIEPLDTLLPTLAKEVHIHASALAWDDKTMTMLTSLAKDSPGEVTLVFHVRRTDGSIAKLLSTCQIHWSDTVEQKLESCFGADAVRLHCQPWKPVIEEKPRRSWQKK
ncbi:MAG: DNA polymerase III subunit alpha [Mariprofundaceae bacterium]